MRDLGAFELDEQIPIEDPSLIVTTTLDVVDQFDGLTSLREAVAFANADGVASEITFDASVFTGGAANLIRLTEGQIVITQALTINGAGVGGVTITGDAEDNDEVVAGTDITDVAASGAALLADNSRLFLLSGADADTTFDSLTLTGGRTTGFRDGGGAVRANFAGVEFIDSTVTGNVSTGGEARGGGIFATGTAVLTNSTVSGNSTTATFASGGGISAGAVMLTDSTVIGNSTGGRDAGGGGIHASTATLMNSTVSGNSTAGAGADGGGIFAIVTATLTNTTVSGNSTASGFADGGGIRANTATLTNSTVTGNSTAGANAFGGGLYAGAVGLTDSLVIGNVSARTLADEAQASLTLQGGNVVGDTFTVDGVTRAGRHHGGGCVRDGHPRRQWRAGPDHRA